MGNSESTPSPVNRSHRLSKPPLNFSLSTLMTTASHHSENLQSSPVTVSLASLDIEAVNNSQEGQQRNRQDTRQKLRAQLFGAEAASPVRGLSEDDNESRNSLGSLVKGMKRLSRSGSLISQNPSARGSATQLVNTLAGSRLSLVPEGALQHPNESDETFQEILEKAEMAACSSQAASANRQYSMILEDDSTEAAMSPYRRRSLFMPGIATRGDDILRRPPSPVHSQTEPDREYYFNPRHSEISPLDKLAALDLAEHGRRSPVVRAETPCDLDFTQLGTLKLGTLRITNGTASPVPSELTQRIRSGRSTPELRREEEDYYTASEGHSSEENSPPHKQENSSFVETGSYEHLYVPPRAGWKSVEKSHGRPVRSGSPLKFQRDAHSSDDEPAVSRTPSERKFRPSSPIGSPALSPIGANSIAQEYISELTQPSPDEYSSVVEGCVSRLPTSPFSFDRTPSPERSEMQVTSKATEYDDMLFDDEGIVVSPIEQTSVPNFDRLLRSSTLTRDFGALSVSETSHRSDETAKSDSSNGKKSGEPLRKTDSGYSSTASLGSVGHAHSSKSTEPPVLDTSFSASEKKPFLPNITEASPLPQKVIAQPRPTLPTRSSLITKPNRKALPPVPVNRPSTESVQTTVSVSSNRSASSTAPNGPKKLQKPRPLSQPPPAKHITVQAYRELAQSHIPPVPLEVASKHAERLRQFPLLEHTYPSLSHTRSNETMSTSEIPTHVPIRFPSPASSIGDDRPASGPRPPPHRDYSALRLFRSERRSSQQCTPGQMGFMTGISDFGTVDKSLGGSPYDVARNSLPPPRRPLDTPSADFKLRRPEATRVKTYTGMGAQEAAELARLRSRTLAERQQLPFVLQQKLSMFDDRAGISGKRSRPKSMITDTPPVPSLSSQTDGAEDARPRTSGNGAKGRTFPQVPTLDVLQLPPTSKLRKAPPTQKVIQSEQQDSMPLKSTHAAAIEFHKSWEPQRQFWRQRRKSAGEVLLTRRSISRELNETPPQQIRPQPSFTPSTATVAQSFRPSMIDVPAPPPHTTSLSPSPRPMSISPAPPPHMHSLTLSPRPMSLSPSPKPMSLSPSPGLTSMSRSLGPEVMGRYDGGLRFGYEAGYGVGGSAGTRSLQNDGTRRGADMSMGYGIDLSDVPIIVGLKRC